MFRSETKILQNDTLDWNLTTLNYTTGINGSEQKKLSKIDGNVMLEILEPRCYRSRLSIAVSLLLQLLPTGILFFK